MAPTLSTERLVIRPAVLVDLDALVARRNDPAVAEYQDWVFPFPEDRARAILQDMEKSPEPSDGSWFMYSVLDRADRVLGDLVIKPDNAGKTAEIGYTFAAKHWGRGYATEALSELIRHRFEDHGSTRLSAMLHPDNVASAMLLERTGFVFEGHLRGSYWLDDENSDDWIYGLTKVDWDDWTTRRGLTPLDVRLTEITPENQRDVAALETHHSQRRFVSPVAASFGDALFPEDYEGYPVVPWYRAVEADGELVGFVMLTQITENHPVPYLWRLLIDRRHQRRGIGTRTLDLIVEVCRDWGADRLETSWGEGRGSPRPVYERYGFVETGRIIDGETEGVLDLT